MDGLDVRLAEIFGWRRQGTFIELGGNDGLQFSNSFLLERELGWRGILIEAVAELAAEAVRNRPKATVICAAVTSSDGDGIVAMDENDLISQISTNGGTQWVATTTLSTVIDMVTLGLAPDFLSIDVEGHELEVLAGLDLTRHRPKWILVETKNKESVETALGSRYAFVAKLSHHDYLYTIRD